MQPDKNINTITTQVIGNEWYPAIENSLSDIPPDEIVENALQIASNNGILKYTNKPISIKVKTMYKPHNAIAVFLIRGVNLSSVGPGASAKNI